MNAIDLHRDHVDPEVWDDPVMWLALAARDITTVYRLLQKLVSADPAVITQPMVIGWRRSR